MKRSGRKITKGKSRIPVKVPRDSPEAEKLIRDRVNREEIDKVKYCSRKKVKIKFQKKCFSRKD